MPDPVHNLQGNVNGNQVSFNWQLSPSQAQADAQWLDIATESGFVAYVLQQQLPLNQSTFQFQLQPGVYWSRINLHYPGFGSGLLDRGWFPSNHILIDVPGHGALPSGSPATNLHYAQGVLSWTKGSGNADVTRQSLDFSTFPNFDDILASPFVPPVGGTGIVSGLPFAFDVPVAFTQLAIQGLPAGQSFYARVNTLYDNAVWVPSDVLHFNVDGTVTGSGGKFPWALVAGAGLLVVLIAVTGKKNE